MSRIRFGSNRLVSHASFAIEHLVDFLSWTALAGTFIKQGIATNKYTSRGNLFATLDPFMKSGGTFDGGVLGLRDDAAPGGILLKILSNPAGECAATTTVTTG